MPPEKGKLGSGAVRSQGHIEAGGGGGRGGGVQQGQGDSPAAITTCCSQTKSDFPPPRHGGLTPSTPPDRGPPSSGHQPAQNQSASIAQEVPAAEDLLCLEEADHQGSENRPAGQSPAWLSAAAFGPSYSSVLSFKMTAPTKVIGETTQLARIHI